MVAPVAQLRTSPERRPVAMVVLVAQPSRAIVAPVEVVAQQQDLAVRRAPLVASVASVV